MKNKILLIDGHNLAHRARHRFVKFSNQEGLSSSVAYGGPFIVSSLVRRFPNTKTYIIFDGGRAKERMELLPGYKDRDGHDVDDRFEQQLDDFQKIMENLNVRTVRKVGEEADDYIYGLCRLHKRTHKTIVSSDKDFIPLLDEYTKIFNPFKDKIISTINCKDVYGFSHNEFLDYLILKGDKSDGIPGVQGLGDKRIRQFLDEYGSVDGFFEILDIGGKAGQWDKYEDDIWEANELNTELISLRYFWNKHRKGQAIPVTCRGFNLNIVKAIAHRYNIKAFHEEKFLKPFRGLEGVCTD